MREPKWFRRDQNYFIAAGIAGFKAKKTAKRRSNCGSQVVTVEDLETCRSVVRSWLKAFFHDALSPF